MDRYLFHYCTNFMKLHIHLVHRKPQKPFLVLSNEMPCYGKRGLNGKLKKKPCVHAKHNTFCMFLSTEAFRQEISFQRNNQF